MDQIELGNFARVSNAPSARSSACCCTDEAGSDAVVVFGGMGPAKYFNDLHVFAMATMQWRAINVEAGSVPSPRGSACMAFVRHQSGERRIVVFGGRHDDGLLGDLHSVDDKFMSWARHSPAGVRPSPRDDAAAFEGAPDKLGGTSFVMVGGTNNRSEPQGDIWAYNPSMGKWLFVEASGAVPSDGLSAAGTAKLDSDKAVFFGGFGRRQFYNTLRLLDLRAFVWRDVDTGPAVPRPRTHAAGALIGRTLYVLGGYCGNTPQDDLWRVSLDGVDMAFNDDASVAWERVELPPAAVSRRGAAVPLTGTLGDGRRAFGAFGGFDGEDFLCNMVVARLGAARGSESIGRMDAAAADVDGLMEAVRNLKRSVRGSEHHASLAAGEYLSTSQAADILRSRQIVARCRSCWNATVDSKWKTQNCETSWNVVAHSCTPLSRIATGHWGTNLAGSAFRRITLAWTNDLCSGQVQLQSSAFSFRSLSHLGRLLGTRLSTRISRRRLEQGFRITHLRVSH
jgi:hypothetical protein